MGYAKIIHEWPDSDAVTIMEVGGDLENAAECAALVTLLWRECVGEVMVEDEDVD